MANLRDLRSRIKSVEGIKKITSTMEMVATARAKKARDALLAARPYSAALNQLAARALATPYNMPARHRGYRFIVGPENPRSILQIMVTADRGLCGGYNSSIVSLAGRRRRDELAGMDQVLIASVGKKSTTALKIAKILPDFVWIDYEGKEEPVSRELAAQAVRLYENGEVDRVELIYTEFISAGTQRPVVKTLLPFDPPQIESEPVDPDKAHLEPLVELEPDVDQVLAYLLPELIHNNVYVALLSAKASEHLARRMAMKQASDSAGEMIRDLRKLYNKTRQYKITSELIEILSAAKAIE